MAETLIIVGGGLAGSEAAWQAARRGVGVRLYEMRPTRTTPAHETAYLAELVCSNSLRSSEITNAVGLLKEELRIAGSLVMRAADECSVPAGGALAVDRERFARFVTEAVEGEPLIELVREEVVAIPEGPLVIIATGPLTSDALAVQLAGLTRAEALYFYDAIAPIVDAETIDDGKVFRASRYGRGGDDYLNCPLSKEEYDAFYEALMSAEKVKPKAFEEEKVFEGCMPIETLASRGRDTPRFGPMKPVGLIDPRTGREAYAVVQLRTENRYGTAYNLVGFQTRLTWPEQQRVFRMIPGLENAEFLRLGSLHRNTYVDAPRCLDETLRFRSEPRVMLAGQITGVEGYVESTAMGFLAGMNGARMLLDLPPVVAPPTTAHGALIGHVTAANAAGRFQPSNVNFGLFPGLPKREKGKRQRNQALADRALADWRSFVEEYG